MLAEMLEGRESEEYLHNLQHIFPHLFQPEFTTGQIASSVKQWFLSPDGITLQGILSRERDSDEVNAFDAGFHNVP